MTVNADTFEKLREGADELDFGGATAEVAAVMHLIPMKLHAIRNGPQERWPRDISDILELARLEALDIASVEFRQLCAKYATMDIYERIIQFKSE